MMCPFSSGLRRRTCFRRRLRWTTCRQKSRSSQELHLAVACRLQRLETDVQFLKVRPHGSVVILLGQERRQKQDPMDLIHRQAGQGYLHRLILCFRRLRTDVHTCLCSFCCRLTRRFQVLSHIECPNNNLGPKIRSLSLCWRTQEVEADVNDWKTSRLFWADDSQGDQRHV